MPGAIAPSQVGRGARMRLSDARARGRADGVAETPSSAATDLAAFEREALAAHAQDADALRAQRLRLRDETLRKLAANPEPVSGAFAAIVGQASAALRQIEGRFAVQCAEAQERAVRTRADLEGFRRAHGLRRAAVYPASSVFQAALLVMAALFEAVFSATLFAQEAEQGLLGGAAIAVGLSGANVAIGFLSGFLGLRYVQHARLGVRIAGGVAVLCGVGTGLALNWFAANWREVSVGGARDLYAPAAFDLLGLTEPQAVILLMLGGGVWVFAALKGFSGFDDPYPDYGKMDRAARDAGEDLADLRADAREALEEAMDACRKRAEPLLAKLAKLTSARQAFYDEAIAGFAELDARAEAQAREVAALLRDYRLANRAARKTPAPAHFDAEIAPTIEDGGERETLSQALGAAHAQAEAAQADIAARLDALAQEMEAASARLEGRAS